MNEIEKLTVHETPHESLGFLLWRVSTSWRSTIESILKNRGLTHPQFVVLATTGWLTRKGDVVSQVQVGKMAGIDPNTNSQIIKGLEKKGLVKRGASSDGRVKNISLTFKGSKILAQALPEVEKGDADFFNELTKKEMASLIYIFQKLI